MGKWTTKDGTELLISEMSDKHLLNAHRMLGNLIYEMEDAINRKRKDPEIEGFVAMNIDTHILVKLFKMRELQVEIDIRELTALADVPDSEYIKEIEYEWERANYQTYCDEHDLPCDAVPWDEDMFRDAQSTTPA